MIKTLQDAVTTLRFCALIPGLEGHRKDLLSGARILEEAHVATVASESALRRELEETRASLERIVQAGQEEIGRLSHAHESAVLDLEVERTMHRATSEKLEAALVHGQAEINRLSDLLSSVVEPPKRASDGAIPILRVPEDESEETNPAMRP